MTMHLADICALFEARAALMRERTHATPRDEHYAEGYADAVYDLLRHLHPLIGKQ